jgi:hypothetical protein
MKNIFYAIIAIAIFGLNSCKDEIEAGEGTLVMKYEAKVNNSNLALNTDYTINGETVYFTTLKFYVSDVHIHDKDGANEFDLKDVALIDFSDESTTSFASTLASGAYKNPMYSVGLSTDLNASDPSSFASDHPMSLGNSMYWMMSNAYIYFKIEGFREVNGVDEPFVYHVGHMVLAQSKMVEKAFSINNGNTTTVLNTLDLNSVFANIDFDTESETHTMNNMPLANKMMSNFVNGISIN